MNDNEGHKLVDLEEADGLEHLDDQVNRGDEGDTFLGQRIIEHLMIVQTHLQIDMIIQ